MQTEIEKRVMVSVAAIYFGRKLLSITALKLYVLCASLIAVASLVSVPHVLANLLQAGPAGFGSFMLLAALNTKVLVQLGLFVCMVVGASFLVDAIRSRSSHSFAL